MGFDSPDGGGGGGGGGGATFEAVDSGTVTVDSGTLQNEFLSATDPGAFLQVRLTFDAADSDNPPDTEIAEGTGANSGVEYSLFWDNTQGQWILFIENQSGGQRDLKWEVYKRA